MHNKNTNPIHGIIFMDIKHSQLLVYCKRWGYDRLKGGLYSV